MAAFPWRVAAMVVLVGCGRTSLLGDHGYGYGEGGAGANVSAGAHGTSTGSAGHPDPCKLPLGRTVLAPLPEYVSARYIAVSGGMVTFLGVDPGDTYRAYRVPVCAGGLIEVATTPDPLPESRGLVVDGGDAYFQSFDLVTEAGDFHHVDAAGNDSLLPLVPIGERGLVLDQGDFFSMFPHDGLVFRMHPGEMKEPLASLGALDRTSNISVGPDGILLIASKAGFYGPIFTISRSGTGLVEGPVVTVPYEIVQADGAIIAAYGSDSDNDPDWGDIERIELDGSAQVLASGQFQPASLAVVRGHAVWMAETVVRAVPIDGGDVIDIDGTPAGWSHPSYGDLEDRMAVDDDAVYLERDGAIVRVPLPF